MNLSTMSRQTKTYLTFVGLMALALLVGVLFGLRQETYTDWPSVATTPYEDATRPNLMVVFSCDNNTLRYDAKLLVKSSTEVLWHIQVSTEQGRKGDNHTAVYRWLGEVHDILVLVNTRSSQVGWNMVSNVWDDGTAYKSVNCSPDSYTVLLATIESLPLGPPLQRGPNGIYVPPKP